MNVVVVGLGGPATEDFDSVFGDSLSRCGGGSSYAEIVAGVKFERDSLFGEYLRDDGENQKRVATLPAGGEEWVVRRRVACSSLV